MSIIMVLVMNVIASRMMLSDVQMIQPTAELMPDSDASEPDLRGYQRKELALMVNILKCLSM